MLNISDLTLLNLQECGHGWTSMKGRVIFWFQLNYGSNMGYVMFKLYGQQCQRCKNGKYEHAMWYPEEVIKVSIQGRKGCRVKAIQWNAELDRDSINHYLSPILTLYWFWRSCKTSLRRTSTKIHYRCANKVLEFRFRSEIVYFVVGVSQTNSSGGSPFWFNVCVLYKMLQCSAG